MGERLWANEAKHELAMNGGVAPRQEANKEMQGALCRRRKRCGHRARGVMGIQPTNKHRGRACKHEVQLGNYMGPRSSTAQRGDNGEPPRPTAMRGRIAKRSGRQAALTH